MAPGLKALQVSDLQYRLTSLGRFRQVVPSFFNRQRDLFRQRLMAVVGLREPGSGKTTALAISTKVKLLHAFACIISAEKFGGFKRSAAPYSAYSTVGPAVGRVQILAGSQ